MTEEIKIEGLGLAQGVLETIVTIATEQVPGVATVCGPGIAGIVGKGSGKTASRQIAVGVNDEGAVTVSVHVEAQYGTPLPEVATAVKESVADAIRSQVGASVAAVNVFIDGIVFEG
ncbi:MAG: Asp23/Gls24 family envelope stress response protein [Actinomycetota bacterium]|nr:Asp23/Gls24 family envelope stress response protein [Coriobacteriia bacterium]MDP2234061.1 Asp23/Gls24 family envelope stress response protein [Actinomycetota bacterium]